MERYGEARARASGAHRLGHPNFVIGKLMGWLENEFLDAPVQEFGDVEFVCGGAGDFVNPAELTKLLAGFAEDAEEFPVEREFVDAAGESVGGVENLTWSWRNANGPWGAGRHSAGGGGGLVADSGASLGGRGDIDGEFAKEFSVRIENLDAVVAAVGNVNIVLRVDSDAVRSAELAGLVARFAPGFEPVAVLVDLGDARIDVAVADVSVAGGIPSHVRNLAEHAIDRSKGWLDVLERLGAFVGGFLLATEDHHDAAFGIELDNHVGAFVGDPDVVVLIDFDGVGEGPGVEVVADFAEEFSVGSKFEELRGSGGVGGAGGVAAREDEDVAFRIDGDTGGFAEINIGRKLQEVGGGMEKDFGRLLGGKRGSSEEEQNKDRG